MFKYLIMIEPLGILYASQRSYLSSEYLVGISAFSFPPNSTTLSGLYASSKDTQSIGNLQIAGPFWANSYDPQNFYIPTSLNYLLEKPIESTDGKICTAKIIDKLNFIENNLFIEESLSKKYSLSLGSWISINEWLQPDIVYSPPWLFSPLLHYCVSNNQGNQSRLFLENAVQMYPDTCLVYLSNIPLSDGWYKFGGEGHMVEVNCLSLDLLTQQMLNQPLGKNFALITSAVWGSTRLSYSQPMIQVDNKLQPAWEVENIITLTPKPFRYRLGGKTNTKRLSRGRYAVSPGSIYSLKNPLKKSWYELSEDLFPTEGYNFKRWGCGLALPLPD
jgi:CRISPR-associated protein Cmr3